MKSFGLLILLCAFTFSAALYASNWEDGKARIKIEVLNAFQQKFPNATDVEWEKEGRYYVAEFKSLLNTGTNRQICDMEAWFDSKANWKMTVSDVVYQILPAAIKEAFTSGNFGTWKVDDAHIVERDGKENLYLLEVEQGRNERDLIYNHKGELVKELKNDLGDYKSLL